MKTLMRSLLIALITACPLIFNNCETSTYQEHGSEADLIVRELRIGGLTCNDCKPTLEGNLLAHKGIVYANVDMQKTPPEFNTVIKHHASVSMEDIEKIIRSAGYSLEK